MTLQTIPTIEEALNNVNFASVREHYDDRMALSHTLGKYQRQGDVNRYAHLAVGATDPQGNHSASEHGLSGAILTYVTNQQIFDLGTALLQATNGNILGTIFNADIKNVKASVGTEMGMMLRPNQLYCTNARSVFGARSVQNGIENALDIINTYKELGKTGEGPEDQRGIWAPFHEEVGPNLVSLVNLANPRSLEQGIAPGDNVYLWADSISNELYNEFYS
jgi:hypothetical protein